MKRIRKLLKKKSKSPDFIDASKFLFEAKPEDYGDLPKKLTNTLAINKKAPKKKSPKPKKKSPKNKPVKGDKYTEKPKPKRRKANKLDLNKLSPKSREKMRKMFAKELIKNLKK